MNRETVVCAHCHGSGVTDRPTTELLAPAPAAPDAGVPEPHVRRDSLMVLWVAKEDYDALRAAYERAQDDAIKRLADRQTTDAAPTYHLSEQERRIMKKALIASTAPAEPAPLPEPNWLVLLMSAKRVDWGQVVMNGGPPCFAICDGKFCLRAERWVGHPEDHAFISLERLLGSMQEQHQDMMLNLRAAAVAQRERDLAIAHDRQPYPTADAYEAVCKARTKWQERAEAAEQRVKELEQKLGFLNSIEGFMAPPDTGSKA